MNKSGKISLTMFDTVKIAVYTFGITMIFFTTYSILHTAVNTEVDLKELPNEIYANRLLYAGSCLAFSDIKTYVGVIDPKKIETTRLTNCLKNQRFSAKITLSYNGKQMEGYNNKDAYLLESKLCFSDRYRCGVESPKRYVAVADNGTLYPGTMEISTVYNAG